MAIKDVVLGIIITAKDQTQAARQSVLDGFGRVKTDVINIVSVILRLAGPIGIAIGAITLILDKLGEFNETIRTYSASWNATFQKIGATIAHVLSGDFLDDNKSLSKTFAEIDQKYGDMAVAASGAGQKQAAAAKQAEVSAKALKEELQDVTKKAREANAEAEAAVREAAEAGRFAASQLAEQERAKLAEIDDAARQRAAIISRSAANEKQIEADIDAGIVQSLKDRLSEVDDYTRERLNLIERNYEAELDAAKQLGKNTAAIERQALSDKAQINSERVSEYRRMIAQLDALEEKHRDAAKKAAKDAKDYEAELQSGRAKFYGGGDNDSFMQRQLQLLAAQKAAREGDTDVAVEQYRKVADAAMEAYDTENEAIKNGASDYLARDAAVGQYEQAMREIKSLAESSAASHERLANSAQSESEKARKSLEDLKKTKDEVAQPATIKIDANIVDAETKLVKLQGDLAAAGVTLDKKSAKPIEIDADTSSVDSAAKKIDAIPEEKTINVDVIYNEGPTPEELKGSRGDFRRRQAIKQYGSDGVYTDGTDSGASSDISFDSRADFYRRSSEAGATIHDSAARESLLNAELLRDAYQEQQTALEGLGQEQSNIKPVDTSQSVSNMQAWLEATSAAQAQTEQMQNALTSLPQQTVIGIDTTQLDQAIAKAQQLNAELARASSQAATAQATVDQNRSLQTQAQAAALAYGN